MTTVLRRGASSARIVVEDDRVVKLDTPQTGTRVRAQGLWLHDYPSKHLPEVLRITARGYEMERLVDVELAELLDDPMPLLGEVWRTYREKFSPLTRLLHVCPWVNNPFVELDVGELDRYVVNLCHPLGAYDVAARLAELRSAITWPTDLTWTHGDLILDNVMRNQEGFVVLIDAIPPCPALPSLAVVDFGRLIQSAAGYEQIRYASTVPSRVVLEDRISTVLNWIAREWWLYSGFDVERVRASLFYAVIHMLRGARTCRDRSDRQSMIDVASDVILRELELWML